MNWLWQVEGTGFNTLTWHEIFDMPFSVFLYLKKIYDKHVERANERNESAQKQLKDQKEARKINPKRKIFR